MMAANLDQDRDTAASGGNRRAAPPGSGEKSTRTGEGVQPAMSRLCEVRMGSLNVGTMEGNALEVVETMKRLKIEVLSVQETKWKGDRARKMADGYKTLHAGGDGRSNGAGIIVNVGISKEVVRGSLPNG